MRVESKCDSSLSTLNSPLSTDAMTTAARKPLGQLLLDKGVLKPEQLQRALIRAAERWRGLRFTEFELRQIAAVGKELNDEYQVSTTPLATSTQPRVSSKSKP